MARTFSGRQGMMIGMTMITLGMVVITMVIMVVITMVIMVVITMVIMVVTTILKLSLMMIMTTIILAGDAIPRAAP